MRIFKNTRFFIYASMLITISFLKVNAMKNEEFPKIESNNNSDPKLEESITKGKSQFDNMLEKISKNYKSTSPINETLFKAILNSMNRSIENIYEINENLSKENQKDKCKELLRNKGQEICKEISKQNITNLNVKEELGKVVYCIKFFLKDNFEEYKDEKIFLKNCLICLV